MAHLNNTNKNTYTMKNHTAEQLRKYVITTVPAFDIENVNGSYFVGWQEGFEPSIIEVQSCSSIEICDAGAIDAAEEAMMNLNRSQVDGPDFVIYRKAI